MPDPIDLGALQSAAGNHEPYTPEWWRATLSYRMELRRPYIETREDYYDGDHPLAFATSKFRETFGEMFDELADNWCPPVVEASKERLRVEGFRLDTSKEETDPGLERAWQANGLDARFGMGVTEAIKLGEAAAIVDHTAMIDLADGTQTPTVTIETPSQVIVAHDPANPRRVVAAMKKWQEDDGTLRVNVYLTDATYRYRSTNVVGISGIGASWADLDKWGTVPNGPLRGFVPVVPLLNNPSLKPPKTGARGLGRSDLDPVIPLQRAINKFMADLIVASEFASFRQRLLSGVEIPTYPEGHPLEGQPMGEAFISAINRLMMVEDSDAKVQEFSAADLTPLVKAMEMCVMHLAAQTRTPPHYLLGQIANVSGDALKAAETGLVSKVLDKSLHLGQGAEDVARLILLCQGDPRAKAPIIETVWANMESRTLAEVTDAALKQKELGVPVQALWELTGASQPTIRRWTKLKAAEDAALMAAALAGTRPGDQGVADEVDDASTGGTTGGGDVAR